MFGSDLSSGGGGPSGEGSTRDLDSVMAHAQALVDTPRLEGGYPLAWHVEAMLVGDFPAIALVRARASGPPDHG